MPARWLPLVRFAWLAIAAGVVAVFITRFEFRSALLQVEETIYVPGLAAVGLSFEDFRAGVRLLDVCTMLVFSAVALFMFWRKSDEWIGVVASLALLVFGATPGFLRLSLRGIWDGPDAAVLALSIALSVGILFIFPDGRFYPRWSIFLMAVICAWTLTWPFLPALNLYDLPQLTSPMLTLMYGLGAAALLYRYRRTGRGSQRLQIKWVIYAILVQVFVRFLAYPMTILQGSLSVQAFSLSRLLEGVLVVLIQFLVPLAFAIAILRYKLWDIDLIISRTLVYVPLTAILAGVYSASIAASQKLFQAFTGQKSDAAVVLTTLLLVALFSPLKDALQNAVDRRYRDRHDALAAVESFGSEVSHVVDVFDAGRITEQALLIAATALRACGGAVYLEQDGRRRLVHTYGEWHTAEAGLEIPIEAHGQRLGCLNLAERQDGSPYSAHDREVLQHTLAIVGLAIHLAALRTQPVDVPDEW